jgi:hypothetical protein
MTQKPGEIRSALHVGVAGGMVQLYCNPATSEVAGIHPTLHAAIATPSPTGALLICDGIILAAATRHGGWLLEQPGVERLATEYNAINSSLGL